jgi:XTP/dITP diphosphohydrolase
LIAVGRAVGEITTAPKGSHGFGFDPVMYLPELGQTFAELDPEVKNQYSHRGRAARQLVALMQAQWA